MKKKSIFLFYMITACFLYVSCFTISSHEANAQDTFSYSSSAQIHEAYGKEALKIFQKKSTIKKIDLYVSPSIVAIYRLINGMSDLASSTRRLSNQFRASGYIDIPFCKDTMIIIAGSKSKVDNLTEAQLRDIFSGEIVNWKELGGDDQPFSVIVPGKETAAYKNFQGIVMMNREIKYTLMTYQSTKVIDAVQNFPSKGISFASSGAAAQRKGLKIININGIAPKDSNYPYYQTFYFITKGQPTGFAKEFIDFTFSKDGQAIMKAQGLSPVPR